MEADSSHWSDFDSEESFSTIFWQQQLKAAKLKNMKQMHWYPAIIPYVYTSSAGVYAWTTDQVNVSYATLQSQGLSLFHLSGHWVTINTILDPSTSGFLYFTNM